MVTAGHFIFEIELPQSCANRTAVAERLISERSAHWYGRILDNQDFDNKQDSELDKAVANLLYCDFLKMFDYMPDNRAGGSDAPIMRNRFEQEKKQKYYKIWDNAVEIADEFCKKNNLINHLTKISTL